MSKTTTALPMYILSCLPVLFLHYHTSIHFLREQRENHISFLVMTYESDNIFNQ